MTEAVGLSALCPRVAVGSPPEPATLRPAQRTLAISARFELPCSMQCHYMLLVLEKGACCNRGEQRLLGVERNRTVALRLQSKQLSPRSEFEL